MTRPKRRTIVRWNGSILLHDDCARCLLTRLTIADDLDQLLLLSIHYVCSANSVKIPWAEVAKVMGHNTSEGAIIQHLDKKRKKRVEKGMAVPPPRKRGSGGGSGAASRTSHTPVAQGRKAQIPGIESCESSDEEWVENGTSQRKRRRKAQTPFRELAKLEFEDSDSSDSEMLVPNAEFLELPNDRSQTEGQRSPLPKQSLVVALKCPKWFSGDSQNASTISPASSSFEQTDTPTSLGFSFPETPIEPFDTPYAQFPTDTSSYFFSEDFQLSGDFSNLHGDGMDVTGDSLVSEYWLGGEMGQQYQE
ncbi:hypothetical protein BJY00DRAFT_289618 [Aspergillus carlsbadensis]|nr:hypothetical protein BJY00DRAFT_289618 [Aspergillus carlsbadensis]